MFVCPECGRSDSAGGFCTEDGAAMAEASDPLLGSLVGSYRVTRLAGFGAMGAVYMAVHPGIGSRVAIKVLNHDPARSPDLVDRFFSEARAVNLIRHEHIVNVLDLAQLPDGRPYIVMEYLDGAPLSALFEAGPMPIGTLARILGEVLDALGSAHAKGVVHRDLKPDNLYVTPQGHVKVLDFGIAKLRSDADGPGSGTRTGSLLGTPHYMSPEQALSHRADARADLYAIGVILFEGVTGQKLFDAPALFELLRKHVEEPPRSPRALRPDLPEAYDATILRALRKDPAQRFQSAQEFAHALLDATRTLPDDAWAPVSTTGAVAAAMASRSRSSSGRSTASGQPSPKLSPGPTLPSAGTYAGASMPMATAPPPPKKGGMGYVLAAILGALVLVAVLGLGVVVIAFGWFASSDSADASAAGRAARGPQPVAASDPDDDDDDVLLPGVPRKGPKVNRKHFDVTAFFPEAERIAKTHAADARFVRLDVSGVRANGTVDLTSGVGSDVLYRFRSAVLSARPADHPANAPFKNKCYVYVSVGKSGVQSYLAEWSCDMPFLPRPRCSLTQTWKQAEARGVPRGNLIGSMGYWADPQGRGRWNVTVRPHFSGWIPDHC